MEQIGMDELFDRRMTFPDPDAQQRLARLVGIDNEKDRLAKTLGILINPSEIQEWAKKFHDGAIHGLQMVFRSPPLVLIAGDVGTGKTELAETIGDSVARSEQVEVILFPVSLSTRGMGLVGEMTHLISLAFDIAFGEAKKYKREKGQSTGGVILLVDEADALAQSREASQMHHEDRAGVNAFIRGVDRLAESKLPAAVIMCTNRLSAIDPAMRRRATETFQFSRPNPQQRESVLAPALKEFGFNDQQISELTKLTGSPTEGTPGFTYSDITQRLIPTIIKDAYPSKPVTYDRARVLTEKMLPTPSFQDE